MPLMITTMVLQLLLLAGVLTFIVMRLDVHGNGITHHDQVRKTFRVQGDE